MHKSFHPSMAEPLPPSLWDCLQPQQKGDPVPTFPVLLSLLRAVDFAQGWDEAALPVAEIQCFPPVVTKLMNRLLGCCTPAIQHWPEQIHTAQWSPTPVNLLWKSPGRSSSTKGEKLYCKLNFYSSKSFEFCLFKPAATAVMNEEFINDPALLTAQIRCKKSKYAK